MRRDETRGEERRREWEGLAYRIDVDTAKSELGGLAEGLLREEVLLIPFRSERRQLVLSEIGRYLLELDLVFVAAHSG